MRSSEPVAVDATACGARRSSFAAALAAAVLMASGCAGERVFVCASSEQCVDGQRLGFCQPAHLCSFPDDGCPSGHRYGTHAPEPLSDACVEGDLVSALVGRWGFDEEGASASDDSGHGMHGRFVGNVERTPGVWGGALRFDGMGSRVAAPGTSTRFGEASISGAAWVRSSNRSIEQARIFGRGFGNPGPGGYLFLNFGGGTPFTEIRDSLSAAWDVRALEVDLADDRWHHLGFVIDRSESTIAIFVDGHRRNHRLVASDGLLGDASSSDDFLIGAQNDNPALSFEGDLDEVWIFTRALSDAEMRLLFQGPALAPPTP